MNGKLVLTEPEAIELYTFLVMLARDPYKYASMRLLEAANRMASLMEARLSGDAQALLARVGEKSTEANASLTDEQGYVHDLDTICAMVAQYHVEQSSLGRG